MDTELVEGSEVRAEVKVRQEKQAVPKEEQLEEVAVLFDFKTLATKPPSIVDYKILKEGRIVKIIRLLDDLEVTTAQLMLLVQKLLLLVLKVNAVGIKVTIAERLQLMEEFMLTEKISKTRQRKNKD
ncbi:hypothetical protein Tco_0595843 [Tanacetum coccineum]